MNGLRLTLSEVLPGPRGIMLGDTGARFVHALEGEAMRTAGDGEGVCSLGADDGAFSAPGGRLMGKGCIQVFRIGTDDALLDRGFLRSERLHLPFAGPAIVRADRVEFPPGAVTPRRRHHGPGLRRLLKGCLLAELGDAIMRLDAGDARFERGAEDVVGSNVGEGPAAFVRVLVLPAELAGGASSFAAADEAEAAKPRAVKLRLLGRAALEEAGGRAAARSASDPA